MKFPYFEGATISTDSPKLEYPETISSKSTAPTTITLPKGEYWYLSAPRYS